MRTRRGRHRRRDVPPRRPLLGDRVEIVSAVDHRTHLVRDTDYGDALAARTGNYRAVCGHTVWPCSMSTPPGKMCPACDAAP